MQADEAHALRTEMLCLINYDTKVVAAIASSVAPRADISQQTCLPTQRQTYIGISSGYPIRSTFA